MARWGDKKTHLFLNLYRENECLWNVRSSLYKNKIARENAYERILRCLEDENMDIKSLKIKIKNLRTIYNTELKKVKDSMRSGAEGSSVYKPKLSWFEEIHSFLGDSGNYRGTLTSELVSTIFQ